MGTKDELFKIFLLNEQQWISGSQLSGALKDQSRKHLERRRCPAQTRTSD